MNEEWSKAAGLCEEMGFMGPASALKLASPAVGKLYLVSERISRPMSWRPAGARHYLPDQGLPRAVFLRSDRAGQYATRENIRVFRDRNPFNYMINAGHINHFISNFNPVDFEKKVGEILGTAFVLGLPSYGDLDESSSSVLPPLCPSDATDEQLGRVVGLFDSAFFLVEEFEPGRAS